MLILGYFFFIFFIFLVPSGTSYHINGIQIDNYTETVLFFIFIFIGIFIYLLKINLIRYKYIGFIIIFPIIIFKIILFMSPEIGVKHELYYENEFIKPLIKINNLDYTAKQKINWNNKTQFPLTWTNFNRNLNGKPSFNPTNNKSFKNLEIANISKTHLYLKENETFILKTNGSIKTLDIRRLDSEFLFFSYDKKNKYYYYKNNYKNDVFEISFEQDYKNENWESMFFIKKNNNIQSAFEVKRVFLEIDRYNIKQDALLDNYNIKKINYFILISEAYEIFLIFFTLFLFYLILKNYLMESNYFNALLILLSFVYLKLIEIIFEFINIPDPTNTWKLSIVLIFILFTITIVCFFKNKYFSIKNINFILIIAPVILFYFFKLYESEITRTSFWTDGDDWTVFQHYGYIIVNDNQWLKAGEDVFYFRPGLRYIIAFLHIIFGKSSFAFKFLEIFSIIGISYLTFLICIKLQISKFISLSISFLLLILFFGESFRWLIGRGLSEYYGTFFFYIFLFLIISNKKFNFLQFFLFLILAFLITWTREDKSVNLLATILLLNFYNYKDQNIFRYVFNFTKDNYKYILILGGTVILSYPIIFEMRNYLIGGNFTFIVNPNIVEANIKSVYKVLLATEYGTIPKITWIFTVSALILSLLNVLLNSRIFPFYGFSLLYISFILPLIFLNVGGYMPRHTIYILPLALIIIGYVINRISFIFFSKKIIN